jgi:hypothetical protein
MLLGSEYGEFRRILSLRSDVRPAGFAGSSCNEGKGPARKPSLGPTYPVGSHAEAGTEDGEKSSDFGERSS